MGRGRTAGASGSVRGGRPSSLGSGRSTPCLRRRGTSRPLSSREILSEHKVHASDNDGGVDDVQAAHSLPEKDPARSQHHEIVQTREQIGNEEAELAQNELPY